jgi:hypothetical protein
VAIVQRPDQAKGFVLLHRWVVERCLGPVLVRGRASRQPPLRIKIPEYRLYGDQRLAPVLLQLLPTVHA